MMTVGLFLKKNVHKISSPVTIKFMALDFFAGCLGGCAGVLVGYPFDTIKVLLQTQDYSKPKYKGTFHCFKSIIAQDSVRGLYKGMSSPMAGVAVVNSLVFGIYGNVQRRLSNPDALSSHAIAGAAAGLAQSFICSPVELAKTRIQLQSLSNNIPKYKSPFHCIIEVAKKQGVRGVFKGLGITMAREVPGFGAYFYIYELLTHTSSGRPQTTLEMLLAGGLAGMGSWIVCYPTDVIKSRIQADIASQYTSTWDCVKKSVHSEGFRVFTRGLGSTLIRAFPTNAACFTVVTWVFRMAHAESFSNEERKTSSLSHSYLLVEQLSIQPLLLNDTISCAFISEPLSDNHPNENLEKISILKKDSPDNDFSDSDNEKSETNNSEKIRF